VTVVAASTAYFVATSAAARVARGGFGQAKIEINTGKPFDRLCTNDPGAADVIELPRRITREEFQRCLNTRAVGIVEVKIGSQALVLARAQLYGPLKLSARDLYLALGRRVPDPNRPERLIDNPYVTWNQVNPALPYDRIQIMGPDQGTPAGTLSASLLLEPGCNTLPAIAALQDADPEQYEQTCGRLREDSAYVVASRAGYAYLTTNPTALGIFSLNEYESLHGHDGLVLNPIDGITPTTENVSAGTYPLARSLYLYTSSLRSLGNQVFMTFVRSNMTAWDPYGNNANGWGFVQLDKTSIKANLDIAQERRELRF
jgi:phosphate transport system substrate-binding protein